MANKNYIVYVREVHIQAFFVPNAKSPLDAKNIIKDGGGEIMDNSLEYSHTLDDETWEVEESDKP